MFFAPMLSVDFPLTLIRYEFLSRIAVEGALPASFSKECYEDSLPSRAGSSPLILSAKAAIR